MSIYLINGLEENLNKSISQQVGLDLIKSCNISKNVELKLESYNKPIFCWAWKSKKSNGKQNLKKYREEIKENDTLLFVKNGRKTQSKDSQTIMYIGNVICCDVNENFARNVWGNNHSLFDFIIFIKDVKQLSDKIYLEEFVKVIRDDKPLFCPNAYKLKGEEEKRAYKKFSSIFDCKTNEEINCLEHNINKDENIKRLESFIGEDTDIEINKTEYNSRIKNRINKKAKRKVNSKREIKDENINEYSKILIGYIGEEKVFRLLKQKNRNINNLLNIKNNDIDIVWFNENQDIKSEQYIDQSIGHGYDMYINLNNKRIFLEVKSSYEEMNLLNFTHNEISTMKKCKNSKNIYYVVIVDRLKNLINNKYPRITIVNNFSDSIREDYIDFSSTHNIFANKLVQIYGVNNYLV